MRTRKITILGEQRFAGLSGPAYALSAITHFIQSRSLALCPDDVTLLAMIRKPKRGLFVTGTDTDVGKTYVAAMIAQSLALSVTIDIILSGIST